MAADCAANQAQQKKVAEGESDDLSLAGFAPDRSGYTTKNAVFGRVNGLLEKTETKKFFQFIFLLFFWDLTRIKT